MSVVSDTIGVGAGAVILGALALRLAKDLPLGHPHREALERRAEDATQAGGAAIFAAVRLETHASRTTTP